MSSARFRRLATTWLSGRYAHTVQAPVKSDGSLATVTESASKIRLALEQEEGQNGIHVPPSQLPMLTADNFQLNGDATQINGRIRLTPSASGTPRFGVDDDFAFRANEYSFSTAMTIDMHNPSRIGGNNAIDFMLQSDGKSFLDIPTSSNFQFVSVLIDPFSKQIGIWPSNNSQPSWVPINVDANFDWREAGQNLRYLWVDYDGFANQMHVYYTASNTKPSSPTTSAAVNLPALFPNKLASLPIGWTAQNLQGSTSGSLTHDVVNWSFIPIAREKVGWLAINPATSAIAPRPSSQITTQSGQDLLVNYVQPFAPSTQPSFIADIFNNQSVDAPTLRYGNLSPVGFHLSVQEDTAFDAETSSSGGVHVNLFAQPGQHGILGGIPLKSFVAPADPLTHAGELLWRDEAGNRIDFQPYTGYDLDNERQCRSMVTPPCRR